MPQFTADQFTHSVEEMDTYWNNYLVQLAARVEKVKAQLDVHLQAEDTIVEMGGGGNILALNSDFLNIIQSHYSTLEEHLALTNQYQDLYRKYDAVKQRLTQLSSQEQIN